jgi:hypothetical protein
MTPTPKKQLCPTSNPSCNLNASHGLTRVVGKGQLGNAKLDHYLQHCVFREQQLDFACLYNAILLKLKLLCCRQTVAWPLTLIFA